MTPAELEAVVNTLTQSTMILFPAVTAKLRRVLQTQAPNWIAESDELWEALRSVIPDDFDLIHAVWPAIRRCNLVPLILEWIIPTIQADKTVSSLLKRHVDNETDTFGNRERRVGA